MSVTERMRVALIGLLLAIVGAAVYSRNLDAPFVFDDIHAIVENPHIRHLWPIEALPQSALAGRPAVSFTFALNYHFGGLNPRGYHIVNIAIHIACGLVLFGLVRRTLGQSTVAAIVALIWLVHPLCTESVAYVVQRTESLMALCYLLTLYACVRHWEKHELHWALLAIAACAAGMASKEPMVSAPIIALLMDWAMFSLFFTGALSRHRLLYGGLAATWLVLIFLMAGNPRSESAGFGVGDSPWHYLLTEAKAIVHYLRLSVWPHPLSVSHPWPLATSIAQVWWQGVIVLALVAMTFWLMDSITKAGVAAFAFFAVLAPTSSFIPLANEAVAERRMYLPLAALLMLTGGGIAALLKKPAQRQAGAAVGLLIALTFAVMTWSRLGDYRSQESMWHSVLAVYPNDPNAHVGLGVLAARNDDPAIAAEHYRIALEERPGMASVRANYGAALGDLGRDKEAVEQLRLAVDMDPDLGVAQYNLGVRLLGLGERTEAAVHFELSLRDARLPHAAYLGIGEFMLSTRRRDMAVKAYENAIRLHPNDPQTQYVLGVELARMGNNADAIDHLAKAAELAPKSPQAHYALGFALGEKHQFAEARDHLARAVELAPNWSEAHESLGYTLLELHQIAEAKEHLAKVIELASDRAKAHLRVGNNVLIKRQYAEARDHFVKLMVLTPNDPWAHAGLAGALEGLGLLVEARDQWSKVVELDPTSWAHFQLGQVLEKLGQLAQARDQYAKGLELSPNDTTCAKHLVRVEALLKKQTSP